MKTLKITLWAIVLAGATAMQSCNDDDACIYSPPTAIVTVCPDTDSFSLRLDNTTTLHPTNIKTSPFGDKEVRALVNYTEEEVYGDGHYVKINWIDSICTKMPVESAGELDSQLGNDPIEIIKDWVTIAEDGYLTLRIRTRWGYNHTKHRLSLVTGVNPENPLEMDLRHNAYGDILGRFADALIAFNLNELPVEDRKGLKIKLNWDSYTGKKSVEFDLDLRDKLPEDIDAPLQANSLID